MRRANYWSGNVPFSTQLQDIGVPSGQEVLDTIKKPTHTNLGVFSNEPLYDFALPYFEGKTKVEPDDLQEFITDYFGKFLPKSIIALRNMPESDIYDPKNKDIPIFNEDDYVENPRGKTYWSRGHQVRQNVNEIKYSYYTIVTKHLPPGTQIKQINPYEKDLEEVFPNKTTSEREKELEPLFKQQNGSRRRSTKKNKRKNKKLKKTKSRKLYN